MKPICAICGRRTNPFAWLCGLPVGPKCAAKLGLTPGKAAKKIKLSKKTDPETGDLFEGIE